MVVDYKTRIGLHKKLNCLNGVMEKKLPRSLDKIGQLFEFLQNFFSEYNIHDPISFPISLAAEELITNCIKYNRSGQDYISISIEHKGKYLELKIVDAGPEFDPDTIPEVQVNTPLQNRKVGGLGIHLVRQLMDSMEYFYKNGQNTIILKKSLEPEDV